METFNYKREPHADPVKLPKAWKDALSGTDARSEQPLHTTWIVAEAGEIDFLKLAKITDFDASSILGVADCILPAFEALERISEDFEIDVEDEMQIQTVVASYVWVKCLTDHRVKPAHYVSKRADVMREVKASASATAMEDVMLDAWVNSDRRSVDPQEQLRAPRWRVPTLLNCVLNGNDDISEIRDLQVRDGQPIWS